MAWPSDERSGDGRALPDEALEFRYYSGEPIALGDLAQSFAAIDRMFALVSHQGERLTVSEVRQGSIIGVFAPFFPQTGQILPYLTDGLAILEF